MKRNDYVFCIGYQGNSALVDGQATKQYAKASTDELLDKGLFRFAFCSALYDKDEDAVKRIMARYNALTGLSLKTTEELKILLGVILPAESMVKTIVIK